MSAAPHPKVSIVVPVYNGAKTLPKLLDALQQQTYPKAALEIIIADNNSNDGSAQLALAHPEIKVVYEQQIQSAGAARNVAIAAATGEILAFTDADCIPAPDWVDKGVQSQIRQSADAVAGEILVQPVESGSSAAAILDVLYNFDQATSLQQNGAATTANLFVRRAVFEKVGGFNPHCLIEDIEFGRRLTQSGLTTVFVQEAIVYHPPRGHVAEMWKKGVRCGRGIFTLCAHEGLGGWLGVHYILRIGRMLLVPRSLHWDRLPFEASQLSLTQRLQVEVLKWLTINVAETWGYGQWLLRKVLQGV